MQLSKEIKIGSISIVILVLFIWGVNFLKGKNIVAPTNSYYVVYDSLDGLIESGTVFLKGYKIGNITEIDFETEGVPKFTVKVVLKKDIKIPLGSKLKVLSTNPIASSNDLELIVNDADKYHEPGDTLISLGHKGILQKLTPYEKQLKSILSGIEGLVQNLDSITKDDSRDTLKRAFAELSHSLMVLNQELSNNGSLKKTFDNLESVSGNLTQTTKGLNSTLSSVENIAYDIDSANLYLVLKRLDSTLVSTNSIMAKIDTGGGTVGKFVNDRSVYDNLDSTSYYLSLLLKDLQENPKRYVHFSLFGSKDKND